MRRVFWKFRVWLWFKLIGGTRYYFDEPNEVLRELRKTMSRSRRNWSYRLAVFTCRRKGHVIDGCEASMIPGSGKMDVWCSRCFTANFKIYADDAPWLQERLNEVGHCIREEMESDYQDRWWK